MNPSDSTKSAAAPARPFPARRKALRISDETLTRSHLLQPESALPLVVEPTIEGVALSPWVEGHRDSIAGDLTKHAALLFRGFSLMSVSEFETFITAVSGDVMDYSYRSTPRSVVSGRIYTSTEYPPDQSIPLHAEMAYASSWPLKIFFFCVQPAEHGGETPVADNRRVFERIDPAVRERFMRDGVMYVRNYGEDLDLPWQDVFQTTERSAVESYCRAAGIEFEWKRGGGLRTRQVCQAVLSHPRTGEMTWFNQAHLFHVSSLSPEYRASLLALFDPEDLPRNAFYGDGSAIEASALDAVRDAYDREQVPVAWKEGDVLLVDNVLAAHGRMPFSGARSVVVGMSEPGGQASAA
jgi:alpha-ketoglutarate-dependent taurine dioxygenase